MSHDPMCMWSTSATPDPLPGYDCGECEQIAKVREDMLSRCEEAAYNDLLSLEDDIRDALGKGSDAARIVAGYRSAMPGFRKFYEEKP